MPKYNLYLRNSPRREDSDSCDKQAEDLTAICKELGWSITREFRDEDRSGADHNRPGLIAALDALTSDVTLIVRNINRLGRDTGYLVYVEGCIRKAGAKLYAHENGGLLDLNDHNALLVRLVNYWQAEKERIEISERTSRVMRRHQANGRLMSAKPPYGSKEGVGVPYVDDKGEERVRRTLVKDPREYVVVLDIVDYYRPMLSYAGVADALNNENVPTRSGAPWSSKVIRSICRRWEEGEFYQNLED